MHILCMYVRKYIHVNVCMDAYSQLYMHMYSMYAYVNIKTIYYYILQNYILQPNCLASFRAETMTTAGSRSLECQRCRARSRPSRSRW